MANRKQSTFERLSSGHHNRQQRRELARMQTSEHPALDIVNRNVAAGLMFGNESHYVAVAPELRSTTGSGVRQLDCGSRADAGRMAQGMRDRDGLLDAVYGRVLDGSL